MLRPAAFVSLATLVAVADQLVKTAVMNVIGPGPNRAERWLVDDWLGLVYVQNRGIAFGLLNGAGTLSLAGAAVIVLSVVAVFTWLHRTTTLVVVGGAIIAGGAVGNLIDRVRYGYVRDFFAVGTWPAFNVADAAITVGVMVACIGFIRNDVNESRRHSAMRTHGWTVLDSTK